MPLSSYEQDQDFPTVQTRTVSFCSQEGTHTLTPNIK